MRLVTFIGNLIDYVWDVVTRAVVVLVGSVVVGVAGLAADHYGVHIPEWAWILWAVLTVVYAPYALVKDARAQRDQALAQLSANVPARDNPSSGGITIPISIVVPPAAPLPPPLPHEVPPPPPPPPAS